MIETLMMRQPIRSFLIGSVLACGFIVAALLLRQGNFTAAAIVFTIGLSGLVGAGKLASP